MATYKYLIFKDATFIIFHPSQSHILMAKDRSEVVSAGYVNFRHNNIIVSGKSKSLGIGYRAEDACVLAYTEDSRTEMPITQVSVGEIYYRTDGYRYNPIIIRIEMKKGLNVKISQYIRLCSKDPIGWVFTDEWVSVLKLKLDYVPIYNILEI